MSSCALAERVNAAMQVRAAAPYERADHALRRAPRRKFLASPKHLTVCTH
jgi:hypothetical protein